MKFKFKYSWYAEKGKNIKLKNVLSVIISGFKIINHLLDSEKTKGLLVLQ